MNRLNFLGIGPKIGVITLPWLAVAILLTLKFGSSFNFFEGGNRILYIAGIVLLIAGILSYFISATLLLKGLKETRLVTTGTFYLCRNPLYMSIILLILPGVAFMMNSWLVLTTSILAFVLFKIFIKSEYAEMEKFFGEAYIKYSDETPEFFPFPVKKWFNLHNSLTH